MKIDWFTVIAQVFNFLILAWLLKRFLYKPILDAIEERENKIAAQLNDAKADKEEAKKEQQEFRQKNEAFDQQKKDLMKKVNEAGQAERDKLMEEARIDAQKFNAQLEKVARENQERLNLEIAQKIQQEVFAIAQKTLAELANNSLEEQSVRLFIKRLKDLKKEEKKKFVEAFASDSHPVYIKSAFELPHHLQTAIKHEVREILGAKTPIEFKTSPQLISGIDLRADGFKLSWSIAGYLDALKKSISAIEEK